MIIYLWKKILINVETKVICADSTKLNFNEEIKKFGVNSVQFIIMHPPYWDIIKLVKMIKICQMLKLLMISKSFWSSCRSYI